MRLPSTLDREDFRHEVAILKAIKTHHNICHVVDSAEDARFGYLVMQSCTGGELFDRIAAKKCTEKDAAMAVLDVLSALSYIHKSRIIHRDLKPENLLYKDRQPGAPLKLIDFGLALRLGATEMATEVCGTTSYMAPDVLQGNYDMSADVWSLGVITYFMLSGTLPFPGKNDDEKEARILEGKYPLEGRRWANVSADAKDFVQQLLCMNPKKRMTAEKAKKHKWVSKRANMDQALGDGVADSLKKYSEAHRFEKAIRHKMATSLTGTELHRLRNVFEKLDIEGTGSVTVDQLKSALQSQSDANVAETLKTINLTQFDLDGDGQVDWQEFVAGAMTDHEVYNEDNLEKVFRDLDSNSDGTLCQKEIAASLGEDHELSREVLEQVKKSRTEGGAEMDASDVKMTLQEFKDVMMQKAEAQPGAVASAATRGRRRHGHAPVSAAQQAGLEKV